MFKRRRLIGLIFRSLKAGRRKKVGVSPLMEDESAGEDMSNILVYNRFPVVILTILLVIDGDDM